MVFDEKYKRIVFVDEDDTLLAPFAAKLLERKLMEKKVYEILVFSAGNVVLFPEPVNPKISELAWSFGISLNDHKASPVTEVEPGDDLLVLCIDPQAKAKALEHLTEITSIYTLREFLGESGEIYCPLGGTMEQYEAACQMVSRLVNALVADENEDEPEEEEEK